MVDDSGSARGCYLDSFAATLPPEYTFLDPILGVSVHRNPTTHILIKLFCLADVVEE